MLTIEEARKIQAKREKACILKLIIYLGGLITSFLLVYFFTDYFQNYYTIYAFFAILLVFLLFKSKIYLFFQKKEVDCTIDYCNIKIESSKKYASNQPGVRYAATDIPMLEIIATDNSGKIIHKSIPYSNVWGEFQRGDKITLLRFINQPIKKQ
jgi:hypothetical protein